jgi:hypothetical protein
MRRGFDEQDLIFDRRDRLDQEPPCGFDLCRRPAFQHRAQRLGEQLAEHLLWRRGVGRAVPFPARHVRQDLGGEAGQAEESLRPTW